MNAIETSGVIDAHYQLRLEQTVPLPKDSRVRVLILSAENDDCGNRVAGVRCDKSSVQVFERKNRGHLHP